MRNIVLFGFMGCGKTTIGNLLASRLNMPFIDMDEYIEEKASMPISEIFRLYGEEHFRALERQAAQHFSEEKGLIISAGGGTMTFPENVKLLKKGGDAVFLNISLETAYRRLEGSTTRPLLERSDRQQFIKELFQKRLPLYLQAADIVIDADPNPETVVNSILSSLKK